MMVLFATITGCSNYKELNELSIVLGLGIDYLPDKDMYEVTYQVVNPIENAAKSTGSGTTPVIDFTTTGKTLSEAAFNHANVFSRRNIYSHVQVVVIGEELARKESLNFIFDIFERDANVKVNIPVLVARNSNVKTLLDTLVSIDKIPVRTLEGKLENASLILGEHGDTKIYDVIEDLTNLGSEPAISGITVVGNKKTGITKKNLESMEKTYVALNGIGVFRKGILVGWMDGQKTKSLQIIGNKIKKTFLRIPCDKKHYNTVVINRLRSRSRVDITNNHTEISVEVKAYGFISELLCNKDISKREVLEEYEDKAAQELELEIKEGIRAAQRMKSDVFGFGEILHYSHLRKWNDHSEQWNEVFSQANVTVHASIDIEGVGMRVKPYPY
ncbi:Ger(x)C family spore germination protein [Paenibacillus rhizovicinus]|uniref:Ger(X)C family spore germination protein n=2 Tax=Paenibacillus rhizovicinus TaxID=2704463 RepID=A0A6C0NY53_9BACL|nr:Ger(x)C family spore germination protein [Paenibacillus rhizovicinus]